jgi:hypothetical protein
MLAGEIPLSRAQLMMTSLPPVRHGTRCPCSCWPWPRRDVPIEPATGNACIDPTAVHTSNVLQQSARRLFETEAKHKTILPTLCAELGSSAILRHRALGWLALRQSAEPPIRKWVDPSRDGFVVINQSPLSRWCRSSF